MRISDWSSDVCSSDLRWCILTPPEGTDPAAIDRVADFWRQLGAEIEQMAPDHHDRVLAITSHLPHLIAYTIVGTASDLEEVTQSEEIGRASYRARVCQYV